MENLAAAAEWYHRAAARGCGKSPLRLALMHFRGGAGLGQRASDAAGVEWLRQAVGHSGAAAAEAQCRLAGLHLRGSRGVAKDPAAAAEWYRKAADQGFAEAQCRLAALYEGGCEGGVGKDESKASELYREAAAKGLVAAQVKLSDMYKVSALLKKKRRVDGWMDGCIGCLL